MQLQFLNHASVKVITDKVRITSDPWYSGAAFNNGWDLIRTGGDLIDIGSDATHFWLSHEHPDHFSLDFFKSTPTLFDFLESIDRHIHVTKADCFSLQSSC